MPPPFPPDYPPLPEEEMELSSGEESEYESGDDEDKERWAVKTPLRVKVFDFGRRRVAAGCWATASTCHSRVGTYFCFRDFFKCVYVLIPRACFISGLLVWWAWSTKRARDPRDRKQPPRERSPGSRICSTHPKQTLRGTPKALMHVTAHLHTGFTGS